MFARPLDGLVTGCAGRLIALPPMAHASDPRFLALHGLKLKGFAEPIAVSAVSGLSAELAEAQLTSLAADGLALYRSGGRISGYALTPAGREQHRSLLNDDLAASGAADSIRANYEQFLVANAELLAVCTAWQVKDLDANVLNDHSDPAYDAAVVERLSGVHQAVTPITSALSAHVVRFGAYQPRFELALQNVSDGQHEWFARPILDSYHTVWMELHEDLLATLSIDRKSEAAH